MTRTISLIAAAGTALLLAAPASPQSATTLTIRHQVRGCHSWSVNGGAYRASQSISLAKGSTITVVDNDVMPHKLVEVSGPALTLARSANMSHPGAKTTVTFAKAGVYRLTTHPGEDYMKGVNTVGADNVLRLTVTVR
jgi:plastocyanin